MYTKNLKKRGVVRGPKTINLKMAPSFKTRNKLRERNNKAKQFKFASIFLRCNERTVGSIDPQSEINVQFFFNRVDLKIMLCLYLQLRFKKKSE